MLGKKERRQERKNRNIKKEREYKEGAWEAGKLIEENHNSGPYTEDYTEELASRIIQYLREEYERSSTPEDYVRGFRKYRQKIQDLLLHWSPFAERGREYQYLKRLLEIYWDEVLAKENPSALKDFGAYDK